MSGFQRAQTIYDAISGRRSIRQYSSDDVSPDTIRRLISMAVMAPSAHNRQQWPFVVARAESRTRRTRQRISSAPWRSSSGGPRCFWQFSPCRSRLAGLAQDGQVAHTPRHRQPADRAQAAHGPGRPQPQLASRRLGPFSAGRLPIRQLWRGGAHPAVGTRVRPAL